VSAAVLRSSQAARLSYIVERPARHFGSGSIAVDDLPLLISQIRWVMTLTGAKSLQRTKSISAADPPSGTQL
jgi:hypothetical protein